MSYPVSALLMFALSGLVTALASEARAQSSPVERWQQDPTTVFEASEVDLDDFRWIARPLVVFAEAEQVPDFQQQMSLIQDDLDGLVVRDVVIVTDTDPDAQSEVRRELRPRGFMFTLIGKDGGVKLRKPFPWDVREISRSIDKMPMRQREIRQGS